MCRTAAPPSAEALACAACAAPLSLLVQLYAPLDDEDVGHPDSFYRCLYVFCCRKGACVNRMGGGGGGVRVLRCQYPRGAAGVGRKGIGAYEHTFAAAPTCAVCGLAGPLRCSRCKGVAYCGRGHQAAHWAGGHKAECGGAAPASPFVDGAACFPEFELVVESEPAVAARRAQAEASLSGASAATLAAMHAAKRGEGAAADATTALGGATPDAPASSSSSSSVLASGGGEEGLSLDDVTRKSLVETTGARLYSDAYLRYFQQRVACEPDQVVRYRRWWSPAVPQSLPQQPASASPLSLPPLTAPVGGDAAAEPSTVTADDDDDDDFDDEDDEEDEDAEEGGGQDAEEAAAAARFYGEAAPPAAGKSKGRQGRDTDGGGDNKGDRLGAPLWLAAAHQPDATGAIPPCGTCGGPRAFEFQIMPQLLWCLSKGREEAGGSGGGADDLDFGTIAVYTCTGSCRGGSGALKQSPPPPYFEEFAWVQPADEEGSGGASIAAEVAAAREQHASVGRASGDRPLPSSGRAVSPIAEAAEGPD